MTPAPYGFVVLHIGGGVAAYRKTREEIEAVAATYERSSFGYPEPTILPLYGPEILDDLSAWRNLADTSTAGREFDGKLIASQADVITALRNALAGVGLPSPATTETLVAGIAALGNRIAALVAALDEAATYHDIVAEEGASIPENVLHTRFASRLRAIAHPPTDGEATT